MSNRVERQEHTPMAFMKPQAKHTTMWAVETSEGIELVPSDVHPAPAGQATPPAAELAQYVGGALDDATVEAERGWFARYSAPGYTDCTDWMGPYPSEARALIELAVAHDDCLLCWDGQCWDGPKPCADDAVEAERTRLEAAATEAERPQVLWSWNDGGSCEHNPDDICEACEPHPERTMGYLYVELTDERYLSDTAAIDYPYDQTWPAADIDGRAHVTCVVPGDTEPQAALTAQGFNPTEGA